MKDIFTSKPIIVALAIFACAVSLSIIMLTHATAPNPGHAWTSIGNGNWQASNSQTQLRNFIFPDLDAKVLSASTTLTWAARTITVSSTLSASTDTVIYVDGTSAPITVTLPSASGTNAGVFLAIRKIDSALTNLVTVNPQSGQNISGLSSVSLAKRGEAIMLGSDGTNWAVLDRRNYEVSAFRSRGSVLNQWYTSPNSGGQLTASVTGTASTLYAIPLIVTKVQTIDQMAINVIAAATGGTVQIGIYNDNGNDYPGTLLVDAGSQSAAATGVKTSTTNLPITVDAGLYWLVSNRNTSTIALRATSAGSMISLLGYASTLPTNGQFGWRVAQATGSLPATYPAGGTTLTGVAGPTTTISLVYVRFSL